MATFTTQSRITWGSLADQDHPELLDERWELVTRMVKEGKTDGQHVPVSDTVSIRYFFTEEAATEFVTAIRALATKYNADLIDAVIEPFEE